GTTPEVAGCAADECELAKQLFEEELVEIRSRLAPEQQHALDALERRFVAFAKTERNRVGTQHIDGTIRSYAAISGEYYAYQRHEARLDDWLAARQPDLDSLDVRA